MRHQGSRPRHCLHGPHSWQWVLPQWGLVPLRTVHLRSVCSREAREALLQSCQHLMSRVPCLPAVCTAGRHLGQVRFWNTK